MSSAPFSRARLEELLKKRFFYAPAFSIYGGVAGLYDYGPPGCALQANMLALWRSHFVLEENMLELDTTILTPHDVLKASGHVDRFTDFMVNDSKTGDFYRADHILEDRLEKRLKEAPEAEKKEIERILSQLDDYKEVQLQALMERFQVRSDLGNELTPVIPFNLMFGASIGPKGQIRGYLRPETAQGQFTNFKRLLECNYERMPFASAQIGKSFRNEISPRAGLLRVREFTMAEIEHYVHPEKKNHPRFSEVAHLVLPFLPSSLQMEGISKTLEMTIGEAVEKKVVDNETLGYFLGRTAMYLWKIGVNGDRLRFRQHLPNEMSHYASDCWDAEIQSSYGWVECVGCADRSAYDLTMHTQWTKEKLVVRERLPEPKIMQVKRLEVSKKDIGMAYKKDAKAIVDMLERLTLCEAEDLMAKTDSEGNTAVSVDGIESLVKLTPAMAKIVESVETVHVNEYTPNVIEPSFGIGRIMYSLLEHVFWTREGDEQRCVLSLPAAIAPLKVLVAPLSNHDDFTPFCRELVTLFRKLDLNCQVDDSSATIGRRYARSDEVGVPFAVTVDFQTVKDRTVTLRERDSTAQVRLSLDDVATTIASIVRGEREWTNIVEKHGLFVQQALN
ncbi:Glycyl-tRNA synthetase/DNA polymerase subunit gamma-2 domain-containing protein [Paramicrosporidium saccamoebae]|uniref:glycine--tRNA ligase n=1 Tax=Paramicrosporidium saccamoebae TaxID=1246581 RepID=A0A2H9TGV6_9FUNG|nr:Glycyl-tRNA synthetase/DNA polymerase subunit gamma-2 domain-containing protein [Paramicrosporidium saccamoebae]